MAEESKSSSKSDVGGSLPTPPLCNGTNDGWGWGGWSFSPHSVFSDLQKAAATASEEITRNAAAVAKSASTRISDLQQSVIAQRNGGDVSGSGSIVAPVEYEHVDEHEEKRNSSLHKLEEASQDSFLGQGLKAFDNSVVTLTSGAWQAIGSAWRGSYDLVHRLESSAANLADSIPAAALPLVEVLEFVGKETMDLLIPAQAKHGDDAQYEDVNFDRCFYIYGGPELLEEVEALSNHHGLLYNRKRLKLSMEQRSAYAEKLRLVRQLLDLSSSSGGGDAAAQKGKGSEIEADPEMQTLYDSSVKKAAELAAPFTTPGLSPNDVIQRTVGRMESLHAEGVHRVSEMCCFAVSHVLSIGKSILSKGNEKDDNVLKFDWPEDALDKAKAVRVRALSVAAAVAAISDCFITGMRDAADASSRALAVGGGALMEEEAAAAVAIGGKAALLMEGMKAELTTATSKVQEAFQFLSFVLVSASMPL